MDDNITESKTTTLASSEFIPSNDITLPKLEEEIKSYINQISQNIIEIGKRLIQAKSLVSHGQWTQWLQNNFQLSQNTAGRFMQAAERFGKSATSQILNQSQMIALLSLPSIEDTNKFIEEKASAGTPVSDMSIKTLRKEIKQWKSEKNKITPVQSNKCEEAKTIDITPNIISQNQGTIDQSVSNDQDIISLNSSEPLKQSAFDSRQSDSSLQSSVDTAYHEKESNRLESTTDSSFDYTSSLEQFFRTSKSLAERSDLHEVILNFAEKNSNQLDSLIQNLTTIISELQALRKKD